jgi:calcineurin-like phosphoesterase family protein
VEFFTTNYDLLLEAAFESVGLPYFDGFVGSVQPFFVPEAVDPVSGADAQMNALPSEWGRVWKLHGSVGWRYVEDAVTKNKKIIRVSGITPSTGDEVVIYPSRDKYSESRRLPYLTYLDRFRRFLASGERILLVNGYSFGDEHLNEVLHQGLQSNSRLAVHAFFHTDIPEAAKFIANYHSNFAAMGRKAVIIGAVGGTWSKPASKPKAGGKWYSWDDSKDDFLFGDFAALGAFLGSMVGLHPPSTSSVPSKP